MTIPTPEHLPCAVEDRLGRARRTARPRWSRRRGRGRGRSWTARGGDPPSVHDPGTTACRRLQFRRCRDDRRSPSRRRPRGSSEVRKHEELEAEVTASADVDVGAALSGDLRRDVDAAAAVHAREAQRGSATRRRARAGLPCRSDSRCRSCRGGGALRHEAPVREHRDAHPHGLEEEISPDPRFGTRPRSRCSRGSTRARSPFARSARRCDRQRRHRNGSGSGGETVGSGSESGSGQGSGSGSEGRNSGAEVASWAAATVGIRTTGRKQPTRPRRRAFMGGRVPPKWPRIGPFTRSPSPLGRSLLRHVREWTTLEEHAEKASKLVSNDRDAAQHAAPDHARDGHQRPVRHPPEPRQRRHGRGVPRVRPLDAADGRAEGRARRVAHARRRRGAPAGAAPRALGPNPNVCRVHDLAPSGWGPILVMEHIPGQTLHTHIRRKKAQGGYTSDEFRSIAAEVCAGLAAIHAQGLVHGDLKPGTNKCLPGQMILQVFRTCRMHIQVFIVKKDAAIRFMVTWSESCDNQLQP